MGALASVPADVRQPRSTGAATVVDLPLLEGPTSIRSLFGRYPTGVAVLAALAGEGPAAVVASSFQVGISLDPPLVLFAVQRGSRSWEQLAQTSSIGVSVLGAAQGPLARQLASADRASRFSGVGVQVTTSGAVLIQNAPAWMECSVYDIHPAGDHELVLLRVEKATQDPSARPLVWHASGFTTTRL